MHVSSAVFVLDRLGARAINVPPDPPEPRLPDDWPKPPPLPHEPDPLEPDPKEPPRRDPPPREPEIEPEVPGKEPPPFEDPHAPPRIDAAGQT